MSKSRVALVVLLMAPLMGVGRDAFPPSAQAHVPCWARTYGTPVSDGFNAATPPAPDGSFVAVGVTVAQWSDERPVGDGYVAKIAGDGSVLWAKSYGGPSYEELHAIRATADGGYVVGGSQSSWGPNGLVDPKPGSWVVKLDAGGSVEWATTDSSYPTFGQVLTLAESRSATGAADGYVAGGWGFGSEHDGFVMKLGLDGSVLWKRLVKSEHQPVVEIGAPIAPLGGYDEVSQIRAVSDGFLVTGWAQERTNEWDYQADIFVLKLDQQGRGVWVRRYGLREAGDQYAGWLDLTPEGDIIVAGSSASYWDRDVWVFKASSANGDLLDQRLYHRPTDNGRRTNESVTHIHALGDGYVIAGTSLERGFLLRIGADLSPMWNRTVQGLDRNFLNVVHPFAHGGTHDGGLLGVGTTYSTAPGRGDAWALRMRDDGTFDAIPGAPTSTPYDGASVATDPGWGASSGPTYGGPLYVDGVATPATGLPVVTPGVPWDTCV